MDSLLQGLGRGILHGVDQEWDSRSNIIVREKGGEGGHCLDSLF